MNRKREAIFMGIGALAGMALCGPAVQAADSLAAHPSSQTFYIDGQQAALTAYSIGGNNYVRLQDIGKASIAQAGLHCAAMPLSVTFHGGGSTAQAGSNSDPVTL